MAITIPPGNTACTGGCVCCCAATMLYLLLQSRFRWESRKMNKCFCRMYSRNFSSNYNNSEFCLQGVRLVLKANFLFSGQTIHPWLYLTTQRGEIFQRCISHIIRVESQLKVFANILNQPLPLLLVLLHCLCPSLPTQSDLELVPLDDCARKGKARNFIHCERTDRRKGWYCVYANK